MISYVLVMIVSLATGQPTHAFVEGPMSDSWCEQLIQQEGYSGQYGATFRAASCLRWPDAQLELAQSFCRQVSGPGRRRHFDCATPETAPAPEPMHPPEPPEPIPAGKRVPGREPVQPPPQPMSAGAGLVPPREPMPRQEAIPAPPGTASSSPPPAVAPPLGSVPESPAPPQDQAPPGAQKRFHLGTAATALVTEAHEQLRARDYGLAEETIERALRIEPDNPVLWVELAQVWMSEGDAAEADSTSRRALALAWGDRQVQASAWRLIAESLRARGRHQEAVDADRQALVLAAQ